VYNFERAAERYGWKRGTKKEIMSRISVALDEIDKRFIPGKEYDGVYTNSFRRAN